MTPDEFREMMKAISEAYSTDEECGHIYADGLMCTVLEELGYSEGVKIFEEMHKWYA